jgi:hypothetical protein
MTSARTAVCPAAVLLRGTPETGARRARLRATWTVLLCAVLSMAGVVGAGSASAHPLSTTAILLDVGTTQVTGRVQLPIDRLAIALKEPTLTPEAAMEPAELERLRGYVADHTAAADFSGAAWQVEVSGGHVESIDAVDHLVFDLALTPRDGHVGDFTLTYDAIVHHLLSHQVFVSVRQTGATDYATAGIIDWQEQSLPITAGGADTGTTGRGFLASVHVGVEHISQGTDHLLFLVMLLLPAPLLARGGRWVRGDDLRRASWRVLHVVTAFAVGHSITLALASLGYISVNSRAVESLIAVSILASAVHAIKPLVPGGEAVIAAGFGLVHGLAFAVVISQLGLSRGSLVVDLLGFNLGIELTQLLVVTLLMPSLMVLSRTRAYPGVRMALAFAGAVLAAAWLVERTTLIATNPLNGVADVLTTHPFAIAGGLAVGAVASWAVPRLRAEDGPGDRLGASPLREKSVITGP